MKCRKGNIGIPESITVCVGMILFGENVQLQEDFLQSFILKLLSYLSLAKVCKMTQ